MKLPGLVMAETTNASLSATRLGVHRPMQAIEYRSKAILIAISIGVLALTATVSKAAPPTQQQAEAMQRQLEQQQLMLQEMQRQLDEQKKITQQLLRENQRTREQAKRAESTAQQAVAQTTKASKASPGMREPADKLVTSGQERIKLSISGQVNRAVNIANDGKGTDAYFVDNDNSNSRVRFVGTAKATDDLTLGTRIEIAIAPDESGKVSQDDKTPGNFIDQRWAEVSLHSKRFGKISLGKGSTASDNSAEVDLSKTDVVQYASIADTAGGLQFRDRSDDTLTGIRVADAFQDEDGLSRQSRLRYDTPTWRGFKLATSAVSDQRWDGSLWWGGQGNGIKAAGALAVSYPNEDDTNLRYDSSFSLLHNRTGLNLTLSGGLIKHDDAGDATNFYVKGGWLTRFFSVGTTAFGLDYTKSRNLPADSYDGYSVGLAAVQEFENYGSELYLSLRKYSLNNDDSPSVQDITVGTVGARVKF